MQIFPKHLKGLKTAFFIDGISFFNMVKALPCKDSNNRVKVKYEILLNSFNDYFDLFYCKYYDLESNNHDKKGLLDYLQFSRYLVFTKPNLRQNNNNFLVEMTTDIFNVVRQNVEHIIIATYDLDYYYLINDLRNKGIHVTILDMNKSSSQNCSILLNKIASNVIDLTYLLSEINAHTNLLDITAEKWNPD